MSAIKAPASSHFSWHHDLNNTYQVHGSRVLGCTFLHERLIDDSRHSEPNPQRGLTLNTQIDQRAHPCSRHTRASAQLYFQFWPLSGTTIKSFHVNESLLTLFLICVKEYRCCTRQACLIIARSFIYPVSAIAAFTMQRGGLQTSLIPWIIDPQRWLTRCYPSPSVWQKIKILHPSVAVIQPFELTFCLLRQELLKLPCATFWVFTQPNAKVLQYLL